MNQDNPFATGVSINQEIVTDDWQNAIDNGQVAIVHNRPKYTDPADVVLSEESDKYGKIYYTPRYSDLDAVELEKHIQEGYFIFPHQMDYVLKCKRQLLALGREEE